MYKVLLIDDEKRNLLLLRHIVQWEEYGFQICGQATDGLEGMEAYRTLKPDLIFVDLRMPVMDGLEFMKEVRTLDQKVCLVILTAYDEFEYARAAITRGVADYLLKPIDRKKLTQSLDSVRNILDQRKKADQNLLQMEGKIEREKIETLLKNTCMSKRPGAGCEVLEQFLSEHGKILAMLVDAQPDSGAFFFGFDSIYQFSVNNLLFFLFDSAQKKNVIDAFTEAARKRKGGPYFLFVGKEIDSCSGLVKYYEELSKAKYAGFYSDYSEVFDWERSLPLFSDRKSEDNGKDVCKGFAETGDCKDFIGYLHNQMRFFKEHRTSPRLVWEANTDLLIALKINLTFLYSDKASTILRHIHISDMEKHLTIHNLERALIFQFECTSSQIREILEKGRMSPPIEKSLEYTKRCCLSSSFSEAEAAKYVNLSKNYFTKLFQKETGKSFWDYVTEIRIGKAKEFLKETSLSAAEIGGKVGYESPCHFSRKFKLIVGITPNDFRRELN